ncbi:hypothetical protein L1889_06780 [Paenalcaligenes niemegkensis]|uniref:hypothetical protein n=1 Tax=Paenalcaligenes niemegkensis TaxID=2895469 RepID=UPI001EE84944|nr:hypothetical protein [Paenalcaligenes niemegkensis]MCQ9616448.1 hypothetical protein [Paenalcaligenes niemegkensis]
MKWQKAVEVISLNSDSPVDDNAGQGISEQLLLLRFNNRPSAFYLVLETGLVFHFALRLRGSW